MHCLVCGSEKPVTDFKNGVIKNIIYYFPVCKNCDNYRPGNWEGGNVYIFCGEYIGTNILTSECPEDAAIELIDYVHLVRHNNDERYLWEHMEEMDYYLERDEIYFGGDDGERLEKIFLTLDKQKSERLVKFIKENNLEDKNFELLVEYFDADLKDMKHFIPEWLLKKSGSLLVIFPIPAAYFSIKIRGEEIDFVKECIQENISWEEDFIERENEITGTKIETNRMIALNMLWEIFNDYGYIYENSYVYYIHFYLKDFFTTAFCVMSQQYNNNGETEKCNKSKSIISRVMRELEGFRYNRVLFKFSTLSDKQQYNVLKALYEGKKEVML